MDSWSSTGTAAATQSTRSSAALALSATNATPGDPVADMRFSTNGSSYGPFIPYSTSASLTLPAGDGMKTVYVQFRNGAGAISTAATDSIVLDQTAPTVTQVPNPAFKKATLGTTKIPIQISWTATDTTSGINHSNLYESVDGGSFTLVASPTGSKVTVKINPGHSYRYRVAAVDNAGNTSAFGLGSTFTLSAYQEDNGAITYSRGWSTDSFAGAYGGSVKYATVARKTAGFSFTGSQVAWVTTVNSDRGSADLSVDAGSTTTVSTNGGSLKTAIVKYVNKVSSGAHVLHLTVLGTSGTPRVDVDAFLVIN